MARLCYILIASLLPFMMADVNEWPVAADKVLNTTKVPQSTISNYTLETDTPYCSIPFSRVGNLILIKAKADTTEGNFILDTGAPGLVLNLTYFRDYPVTTETNAEQSGITGTGAPSMRTNIDSFTFGTFHYSNVTADLANLGHIENSKNIRIFGLIGLEFFKECEMIIDFEASVIHLQHISKKIIPVYTTAMLKDESAYSTLPIDIMDNRIITTTELGGKKLKMIIDCAAESSILNSKLPNKQMELVTISRRIKLTGSGSKQIDALYGDVSKMKIGSEEITKLPVIITNLANTCFSYNGCIDGVLGFDFLSLHKIGFNFVKHKMYIWK
jgi:hypothetical protein